MAAQRKKEILDAFEQCILQDSLEATSLEKLAEQANMKRSILRHYIGNRDDIIVALSERYRDYYDMQWQQTLEWLPRQNRIPTMIDILFGERDQEYVKKSIVGEAIYSQAKRLKDVREHQLSSMKQSINIITNELRTTYPKVSNEKLSLVARGILAAYMNGESFLPLDLNEEIKELKQLCLLLIDILKE
jgi:AcrR family transcriptional regulator